MQVKEAKTGAYTIKIAVPESVEAFDQAAGKVGACLETAIWDEIYHGTLGDIRAKAQELIEKAYNTKRRDIGTGVFEEGEDGKKVEVTKDEKWDTFLDRVAAENSLNGETPFADIFTSLGVGGENEVAFDPSAKERKPGAGLKLPKYATEAALAFIDKVPNPKTGKAPSIEKFAQAYHKMLGKEFPVLGEDREQNLKTFAIAYVEWNQADEKEKRSKF